METAYCFDCDEQLDATNTGSYKGFDGTNYELSKIFSNGFSRDTFTKCDDCFDKDIDMYLETQLS